MEHRPSLSCSSAPSIGELRLPSEAASPVRPCSSAHPISAGPSSRGAVQIFLTSLPLEHFHGLVPQASVYALKGILKGASHAHKTGVFGYPVFTANLVLWLGPSCGQEDIAATTIARNLSLAGFDTVITRKGFLRRTGLVPSLFGEEG